MNGYYEYKHFIFFQCEQLRRKVSRKLVGKSLERAKSFCVCWEGFLNYVVHIGD